MKLFLDWHASLYFTCARPWLCLLPGLTVSNFQGLAILEDFIAIPILGGQLQGIVEFISPEEFYWKELIRSLKVQKRIGKNLLLGSSNKVALLSTNIEFRTDMVKNSIF